MQLPRNSFKVVSGLFRDILPIIAVVVFFQLVILRQPFPDLYGTISGIFLVAIGLFLFTQGLALGLFPLGESLAFQFAKRGSLLWLLVFGFTLATATTVAEPALLAVAEKAAEISEGRINPFVLRSVVALGAGLAIVIGVMRVILGHPIYWYILGGYSLIVAVTGFAPPEIIGLAYDAGGVTTSTVTVPLVAALGVGLASSIEGRNPLTDGFGMIALAALMPILTVMLYGIWVYQGS